MKRSKNVKIAVALKYLSDFWKTLETPLINCEINLILTWSSTCVFTISTGAGTFAITDIKFYVPVVNLSTQDNAKLLDQLKSGLKRKINWNKYESKVSIERQNQYLNCFFDPSFQGGNRRFVLSFEDNVVITWHTGYFLPVEEKKITMLWLMNKTYPVKNDLGTYDNIQKTATGQGDDNTAGYLLYYPYFKKIYCIRYKYTTSARCRFKSNTANWFYYKYISRWRRFLLLKNQNKPFQIFHKEL